jgi:hypothetical protein
MMVGFVRGGLGNVLERFYQYLMGENISVIIVHPSEHVKGLCTQLHLHISSRMQSKLTALKRPSEAS